MTLYKSHAVANGFGSDHPIPGLPFVDDSHIPLDDSAAIEAIGRRRGGKTWGRDDPARPRGRNGWVAYTTDPVRHDLAWVVRWHPDNGRSVIVYRDSDAVDAYTDYVDGPLLFRSGGYWWDGGCWYRPQQVIDWPGEGYYRRAVPAATTVTAAGILAAASGDPARGSILAIADIDPDVPYEGRWNDDLALWAQRRDGRSLDECVVSLTAPELTAEHLIGATEFASAAGIASSTLRAYIARGEGRVPLPQAVAGGRSLWARPVAEEWAEQRQRDPDAITASVSITGRYGGPVPAGQAELATALARSFLADLWDWRPFRSRWALRWRTRDHVAEVADALAHEAASYVVRDFLPIDALSLTLSHALLDDLRESQRGHESALADDGKGLRLVTPDDAAAAADNDPPWYSLMPQLEDMLTWLARHQPSSASHIISEVIGEAERNFGIPRHVTAQTFRYALPQDMYEFADKVLPPTTDTQPPR